MAVNKYFRKSRAFSFKDIVKQYTSINRKYEKTQFLPNKNTVEIMIQIQPTEESSKYTIKIVAKQWSPSVNVFVVDPDISKHARNRESKIPHTYPDGSLCLYLPRNNEWDYYDSWADTLIPWACLWLYYFEIWFVTDEWLGGGVHPGDDDVKERSQK